MGSLSPSALAEIAYAAYDEVMNRRKPVIADRYGLPFLKWIMGRTQEVGGFGGKVIVKMQQESDLTPEHWSARDVLTFSENRVDFEIEFPLRRTHLGLEILHEELENEGYTVTPNKPRTKNFASKVGVGDVHRVMDIFEQKIDDWMDRWDVSMDEIFLRDGSQDALAPVGLDGYMTIDPTSGTLGGKPRSNPMLQHQVKTGSTTTAAGSLYEDLTKLQRDAARWNRGTPSQVDVVFAGSDWIDGYVKFMKNNGLSYQWDGAGPVSKLDIGIPDSAIRFQGIPVVHVPTFRELDAKGLDGGYPWEKRAYGLASKSWKLCHTPGKLKEFSAPMDPPTQRFTRMSLDGRHVLVPTKIRGNWLNTLS